MGEDMIPILFKANKESNGKTIDIVFDFELPGITQEMYEWWFRNMADTRHYKMWHKDHISFEVEKTNNPNYPVIAHPTERLGKYGPSTMAFTREPLEKYPFKRMYKNYNLGSQYAKDGLLLSLSGTEWEDGPKGLKIHAVERWPAKAPQDLVDALRQHIKEENENFPKFLPELYQKESQIYK